MVNDKEAFHTVLFVTIKDLDLNLLEQKHLEKLSETEHKLYNKRKGTREKIQFLMARVAIKDYLSQYWQIPCQSIQVSYFEKSKTPQQNQNVSQSKMTTLTGKPKLSVINLPAINKANETKYENINLSISHSDHLIACALTNSNFNIGVDIEDASKSRQIDKLSAKYFSSAEKLAIKQSDNKTLSFYRLWCIKESLYKIYNTTLPHRIFFSFNSDEINNTKKTKFSIVYKNEVHHAFFPITFSARKLFPNLLFSSKPFLGSLADNNTTNKKTLYQAISNKHICACITQFSPLISKQSTTLNIIYR